jgi:tripartite-type tricarboxylate transporter receptor subunit TctC
VNLHFDMAFVHSRGIAMTVPRRRFLHLAAAAAVAVVSCPAHAETYPAHPVHIIVGFPAGGPQDITARLIAQWLSDHLGQQFLVESRAGAGGTLGAEYVVNSPPDGYTLLLAGPPNTIGVTLYDKLKWNFVQDTTPVAAISKVPLVAEVNPALPVKSIPELIAYAKANPNKINYGSAGVGTPQHVAGELFKMMTGVAMQHVPYRGSAPALTDLLGGQIQLMIETTPASLEHIRAGRFRGLAVTTLTRAEALPDLPTVSDFLPGYEAISWYGLVAPKHTPADIVEKLNKEVNAGLADPKLKARLAELGGTVLPGPPAQFGKFIADEADKWGKVVKTAHMKAE